MLPFDITRLTQALTAAAIDSSRWTDALEMAASCTGSFGAILLPVVGAMPVVWATQSMEKSAETYLQGGWPERDERYRATGKFLREGVATDDDCMPREDRRKSAFYMDFLASCNLSEFAGVRVGRRERVWNMSLQRTPAQGPYTPNEIACLSQLADTLDSIVEISHSLDLARGDAALDAFDFTQQPAALLDRAGKVVRLNAAAEYLFQSELQITGCQIRCRDPQANQRLTEAIKEVLWNPLIFTVRPVTLPKDLTGGTIVAYPMRLPGLTDSPLSAFHAIMVFVDTDAANSPSIMTLQDAFGLTPAEARVAAALVLGNDLMSYSEHKNLSKETVRNQLKSIFAKTGTNRQAELALVLRKLLPGR